MNQHKDLHYWKKRKAEVEKAIKILAQKREKTLYLYEVEKQSRQKARELPLRTLLEYETKELQQTRAGLQNINATITELEKEQQKYAITKIIGVVSIFALLFSFMGLMIHDSQESIEESAVSWTKSLSDRIFGFLKKYNSDNNVLTGAVVGIQPGIDTNCREEHSCVNETITTCKNETIQKCDAACVNETKTTCVEECKPECHPEEINGVEREVCVTKCSEVCAEEMVENCGSCIDVVEEKCSSEIVEQCSTTTVCDEVAESDVTEDISTDIVEESPEVGIQPIVEEPVEENEVVPQPIEEEIPADEMTGGAISIPEEETNLEIPPVEESPGLIAPPVQEEPIEETPITQPNETEPIENIPSEETAGTEPPEPVKKVVEEIAPAEEKSLFSTIIDSILNLDLIKPNDLDILAINRMVLNTTYVTQGNGNVNLTAYTAGTDVKYIYNWKKNDTPIAVVHMTFDGGSDPAHATDYSGKNNIYNSSYQGKTIGFVDAFNGSKGSFSVDSERCNGAANAGEWDVNGTVLVDHNGVRLLNDTNTNTCVATQDGYLGVGFIMYTKTVVGTRFTAFSGNHAHFIYVNYTAADGWRYDSNTAWTSFTPEDTDVLVAYVDSNANTGTEFPFLPNLTLDGYNGSRGMRFNGSTDFVNLTDAPNFDFGPGGNFSISIWVRANSSGVTRTEELVSKLDAATSDGYILDFNTGNPRFIVVDGGVGPSAQNETDTGWKDDKWHHWVGTFNSGSTTDTALLYIDGVLRGSGTGVATNPDNAVPLHLGSRPNKVNFFNGTLDEFMLFNRTLSSAEVWNLWTNQTNVMAQQELNKGDKWTVEVTPNTGTADGTMMSQSVWIYPPVINSLTLNSTDPHTNDTSVNLTAYANVSDADGDSVKVTYNWLVNGSPMAVLNMPFERINNTAFNNTHDYSGRGNNGSALVNAYWNATGGYDGKGAYKFNMTSNSAILIGNNSFQTSYRSYCTTGCTINAWVYPFNSTLSGTGRTIIGRARIGDGVASQELINFYQSDSVAVQQALVFTIGHNASSNTRVCTATTANQVVLNATWQYVTARYNVTHTAVFINGTQVAATTCSFANVSADLWGGSAEPIIIGAKRADLLASFFNGTIDEVTIFNRSLSAEQIFALWQNKTNVIVAQETARYENWSVQAIPNDGLSDGMFADGSISIANESVLNAKPTIAYLRVNTTNQTRNNTVLNVTVYTVNATDVDSIDSVKVIYNWLVNGSPIAVLNMPFERINGTSTNNAYDYSGRGTHGNETNTATWDATGGYDDKGAYHFDGNDRINLSNQHYFESVCNNGCTFSAWINWTNTTDKNTIIGRDEAPAQRFFSWNVNAVGATAGALALLVSQNGSVTCVATSAEQQIKLNQWQHVAGRYNGTHTAVFVNGTQQAATACSFTSVNYTAWQVKENTFIGGRADEGATEYFNGTIDDVLVFNRSLSTEQIFALFQNKTNTTVAQETAPGENWSVQAIPNDGIEDGLMNTSNNVTILNIRPLLSSLVLNSTNISSNNTDVNITAYANGTDTADGDSVKVIYNWVKNATTIQTLNMPFEGINNTRGSIGQAWDYSGLGNNASENNGPVWNSTGGYDGRGAYEFDGANDYLTTAKGAINFLNASHGTMEVWIRPTLDSKPVSNSFTGQGIIGDSGGFMGIFRSNISGTDQIWTFNWDGNEDRTGIGYNRSEWVHIAWRHNGTSLAIFKNGFESGSVASGRTSSLTGTMRIGTAYSASSTLNGTIDDVRIWNRSLSAEQIFALFQNKSHTIVAQETFKNENWTVQATPNDGSLDGTIDDGSIIISGNVSIRNAKPVITPPILNTTNLALNDTTTNLTAYHANVSDADSDSVKVIYNWIRETKSIMVANMPFEGINGTTYNNSRDYSSYNEREKVLERGNPFWNSTGGHDGKGAYNFDGTDDFISVTNESLFDFKNFTYVVWFKADTNVGFKAMIDVSNDLQFLGFNGASYNIFGRCGNVAIGTSKLNVWSMLAWVVNGSSYFVYENATLIGSGSGCSASIDGARLHIGAGSTDGVTGDEFFDGHLDDVKVFNFSLSPEQISTLYLNRTNEIANTVPSPLQNWSLEATANDGTDDGVTVTSNNVTIRDTVSPTVRILNPANHSNFTSGAIVLNVTILDLINITSCSYSVNDGVTNFTLANCSGENNIIPGKGYSLNVTVFALDSSNNVGKSIAGNITVGAVPNISALTLRTTNLAKNDTTVNLTAAPTVNEGDSGETPKVIFNWYINNSPLLVANLPFERLNGTNGSNAKDYAGLNPLNKISERGGVAWNDSRGHDGKGVYHFDGTDDFISVNNESLFDLKNFTFVAWITADSTSAGFHTILDIDSDKQLLGRQGSTYSIFGRCGSVSPGTVKVGIPTMLTWSVNGTQYQLYENTTVISSGTGCSGGVDGTYLNIGAGSSGGVTGDEFFDGYIDDVKIFNVSLTAEQVSALYYNRTNETASSMLFVSQNWSVDATPNDGYADGNVMRSNNVTILAVSAANTPPPAPVLYTPTNLTTTTSRTPTFVWNTSTDADNDPNISYHLEIDNSILFDNLEVNLAGILNTSNISTTFTISTELAVDTTFFWRVYANDSKAKSTSANVGNFTVQSLLSVNITNEQISFGTLAPGANASTPANANPFRGENVGNIVANITVTGTSLFTAVGMPSTFYRFKIRANESGAFNTTASATEWNETNSTLNAGVFHVVSLDWRAVSNDFLVDLNISVPVNESPGTKSSNLTFTITG